MADDEASIRDLLAKALALDDYVVDVAEDGETALRLARAASYDLLITDVRMPRMDGLTLVREVRRNQPNLPVLVITGFSSETTAIDAINLGVAGYLVKPFRVPHILAAVAKVFGD